MKIIGNYSFIFKVYSFIVLLIFSSLSYSLKLNNYSSSNEMNFLNLQKALLSSDTIQVLNVIRKQPKISTNGLFFEQGIIYESGIFNTQNFLLKKNYANGQLIKNIPLGTVSGRGVAKCNNFLFQITEKEKRVLKYSFPDLNILTPVSMDSELENGEGLASLSNEVLVATDGSNNLHILDCVNDLNIIKSIPVFDESTENPMSGLLDIVVVGENVYANRKNDNRILKIDPKSGAVIKYYDMINLINFELKMKTLSQTDISKGSVLNGISYDSSRNIFILTGRNWGFYYEVELK